MCKSIIFSHGDKVIYKGNLNEGNKLHIKIWHIKYSKSSLIKWLFFENIPSPTSNEMISFEYF